MASPLDPNDLVTVQELTISNMWEVAALIQGLEKKGLLTKKEILVAIRELREKNPTASATFPNLISAFVSKSSCIFPLNS
jgi:hypothetical protein